jgi:hypothetical protein
VELTDLIFHSPLQKKRKKEGMKEIHWGVTLGGGGHSRGPEYPMYSFTPSFHYGSVMGLHVVEKSDFSHLPLAVA